MIRVTFLLSFCLALAAPAIAVACPKQGPLVDYNCDQALRVVVIGDSIVYGIGDTANKNRGGYVKRIGQKLRSVQFVNLGVPGLHASKLVAELSGRNQTKWSRKVWEAVRGADVVILDAGRNDRWKLGPPKDTFNDLKRSSRIIQNRVRKETGVAPWVTIAVLMIPNRGAQAPWVAELNEFILANSRSVALRFDQVSKRLLQEDRIHPTPAGYASMADIFRAFLTGPLQKRLRRDRKDADKDGIYDIFETIRFGTDPANPDSDGNGLTDGEDIFGVSR